MSEDERAKPPLRETSETSASAALQPAQRAEASPAGAPASIDTAGFGPAFANRKAASASMLASLAENWWVVGARGLASVLFGLFALLAPGATLISLALVFALYMLIDGILGIVAAIRAAQRHERWGLLVFEGLVDLAAGLAALFWPAAAIIAFVVLMAVWALISGGLMLVAALKLDKEHGRTWLALGGFASLLLGVMLLVAPLIGALVFAWWLGAYALVFGGFLIALAFKLKARRDANATAPKAA